MIIIFVKIIFPWIIGLVTLIFGNTLIKKFLVRVNKKCELPENKSDSRASKYLGFLETLVYALAYLKYPEFIAVWLAFKAIDRWSPVKVGSVVDTHEKYIHYSRERKSEIKRAENNIYLIANLLSILLGSFVATVITIIKEWECALKI